ncbi:MAG: DNA repair protein RadC [Dehalococcoidia bacterium]|nr:DNA repair protein RadC [Dehalococcoidia bacterium]
MRWTPWPPPNCATATLSRSNTGRTRTSSSPCAARQKAPSRTPSRARHVVSTQRAPGEPQSAHEPARRIADDLEGDASRPAAEPPVYRARVVDLPASERPRERLGHLGPSALTTAELLAILLGTGSAQEDVLQLATRLVAEHQGLRGIASADLPTLTSSRGLGPAKATTIAAAFELGRRLALESDDFRPMVRNPVDIARLLQPEMEVLQQEELRLLVLDTKHRVLARPLLYRGSVNSAPGRVAEIFRDAVRNNAVAIAVTHNHPSGDPTPSRDDIAFTRAIIEAGALLDISVLDHVVFGRGRYVSMRERKLGFE